MRRERGEGREGREMRRERGEGREGRERGGERGRERKFIFVNHFFGSIQLDYGGKFLVPLFCPNFKMVAYYCSLKYT